MCNSPIYRLVLSDVVVKILPRHFYKRVKANGIIMSRVEFECLTNVYSIPQEQFQVLPCGQCLGCKIDYQNMWTTRAMCEASLYKENYFITLTYNDENIPKKPLIHVITGEVKEVGVLVKEDFTAFFKRLRRRLEYLGFNSPRFLACGEYGDTTKRPHFHFLGFNLHIPDLTYFYSRDRAGRIHYDLKPNSTCYYLSNIISECWGKGFILITPLTLENCSYVCSYVNKQVSPSKIKHTRESAEVLAKFQRQFDNNVLTVDNAVQLGEIPSPFLHMSRKKGIGNAFFTPKVLQYYYDFMKLPNIMGKKLPKQSVRYFDNLIAESDVEFVAEALKRKRKKRYANEPFVQFSDYGQAERDKREEILTIKQKNKKKRDF